VQLVSLNAAAMAGQTTNAPTNEYEKRLINYYKSGSAGEYNLATAHCNAPQRTAMHCNALQCTATHCDALQRTATHGNALRRTATHCHATSTHTYITHTYV